MADGGASSQCVDLENAAARAAGECALGAGGAADLALVVLLEPQAQANEAALLQRRQITKVTPDVISVQLVCGAKGGKEPSLRKQKKPRQTPEHFGVKRTSQVE